MANVKKMQEETMASIDTAKALIDKVLTIMEIVTIDPSATLTFSMNPIGYLIQLLKHLGVTREELESWLVNFLIYVIPVLEVSVKAILLTNLKNMISCSVDPRIPEKYRKQHKGITDYNTSQEYGIDINIESIDFMDKLSINPLGELGSNWYFGLEGVEDSYKFARAEDMDAFLWFVIHKGKFPNSSSINSLNDIATIGGDEHGTVTPSDGSLLSVLNVTYGENSSSKILLGNTFKYSGTSHTISMCIDRKMGESGNTVQNTLVPVSDDWSSVNWYINNSDKFVKNLGFVRGKTRDFNKERGICNIQYIDQTSSDAPITGLVNNKFRFTILPKPLVHIPKLSEGEPPWRFKKMLFNDKGEYDSNGKYTLVDISDSQDLSYLNGNVKIDARSGTVKVEDKNEVIKNLIECYPGLTVFEFNYDYVMSMKLFDAKVLAHSLMESVLNFNMGIGVSLNMAHQDSTEKIKQIIKNILESDESIVNDCYYTFDSSKYDALLRKSEEKRARQQKFGNITHEVNSFKSVNDILQEYNADAELHERKDVIHRAITQASITVSEGLREENKFDAEYNFIFDLVEALTTAIVNGILSPKVLMLLEVNQTIMGGTWEKFSMQDLLEAFSSIIVAVVKEIRDLVIQELLNLVLKVIDPIKETISSILLREQLENYSDAILEIIRNCPRISFNFGANDEETKLDVVDYADIDTNKDVIKPSTNNC